MTGARDWKRGLVVSKDLGLEGVRRYLPAARTRLAEVYGLSYASVSVDRVRKREYRSTHKVANTARNDFDGLVGVVLGEGVRRVKQDSVERQDR